jgi:tRNA(Arg) A34 adenosine deaminase TadA
MRAAETWHDLDGIWQEAFTEAWTSWCAGCWGIGAVVTDTHGEVVSRGRNRILEPTPTLGVLAGTPLAHAEMNALAALPVGPAAGYRLHSTLEPCVMCAAAIRLIGIPEVRYAGFDPLFEGIHDHLAEHPYGASRPCEQVGPMEGPVGRFASLLPLTFMAFWAGDSPVFDLHRRVTPDLAATAERVVQDGTLAAVSADGGGVVDALEAVWPSLA